MQEFSGKRLVITGMGHWAPANVITNEFFSTLAIDSDAEWIAQRTGIIERRSIFTPEQIKKLRFSEIERDMLVEAGVVPTLGDMSAPAWRQALDRSGRIGKEFSPDVAIAGFSIPDVEIPANACGIAKTLNLTSASFDNNSACSSFVVNLMVARGLAVTNVASTLAIFNPERYSLRIPYSDRSSCVLFGDGAAASILECGPDKHGLEILDTTLHSDPSGANLVTIPQKGYFQQSGQAVQKFAVTRTVEATLELLDRNRLTPTDLTYFVGHQANLRMLTSAVQKLAIPPNRHLYNVDRHGNQGAAGAPSVLAQNWERFKPGDVIAVAVVGGGLTWGAALLKRV